MSNIIQRIKKAVNIVANGIGETSAGGSQDGRRNLSNYISPVQLQRLRHDVRMWREAVEEAENAWTPHRVKMQRLYIDTILNGHVSSVMERRKDLTLLRDFHFIDAADESIESDELKKQFDKAWFGSVMNYALDALFYGYSLISLGDIVNDTFKNPTIVRRWNISPDRLNVTQLTYSLSGAPFLEEPYADWHLWLPTETEHGMGNCGYGLLYKVALYEIFLRNTLGYNGDFVELFAMPYRIGKTSKTDEAERGEMETALQNMGSAGWAILDPMDEIELLENNKSGTGYTAYESLEKRCEARISKMILGHADAMDSTAGKLGSEQGGDDSPIAKALKDKQTKDGKFIERVVNDELLPKMRLLGFNIPDNWVFAFKNDAEKAEIREREDKSNLQTAQIAQTMKNAGLKMSAEYFQERTGIETEEVQETESGAPDPSEKANEKTQVKNVQNKLNSLYK